MSAVELVERVWRSIDARDWASLRDCLAADVVLEYPASDERFVGAADVVAVNAEYPEGWSVRVLRVVGDDEQVVSEVEVPMEGVGTFRVASFWTVRDARVTAAREYWVLLGEQPAPAWRRPYTAGR